MKYLSAIVCVLALFVGCTDRPFSPTQSNPPDNPPDQPPLRSVSELTANEQSLVGAANEFGLDLFQRIVAAEPVDKNVFISPLSASYALAMAYNGADGTTREAIAQTLRINGMSVAAADTAYQQLTRILMNTDPAVTFSIANAVWYRLGIPIHPAYVTAMESFFGAKVKGLDFALDASVDTMNAWASDATRGKIPKVIDAPIDPTTMFILMNAIYFKGAWTYPFDATNTMTWNFATEKGEQVTADFMRKGGQEDWQLYPGSFSDYLVLQNDTVSMISLPYGQKSFQMAIICPGQNFTSGQIVGMLTPEIWSQWRSGLHTGDFALFMPKFRLDYDIRMNDVLQAMGMDIAFGPGADFSNLTTSPMSFFISMVKQNAFVQVDEKGTEAAAVTTVIIATSLPPQIICTKPFIYIIYEKTSGTILFLGRLGKPEWKE